MKIEQTHDSSLIDKTIFNDEDKTLEVHFKNGGVYEYSNFEQSDYDELINAASAGSHFSRNIKTNFPFSKLS